MRRPHLSRTLIFLPSAALVGALVFASLPVRAPALPPAKSNTPSFAHDALPLVRKYCVGCHGGDSPAAGIDLARDKNIDAMLAHRDIWDKAATNVDSKRMPPADMPAPTPSERARLVDYIQSTLSKVACVEHDPGRVTVRRLNRVEYDNSIRDLTGLDLHVSDDFPGDSVGYGFDNIGDVLSLSPLQLEKYLAAAGKIAHAAIATPEDRAVSQQGITVAGYQFTGDGAAKHGDTRKFASNGTARTVYHFPAPGRYRIRIVAWQDRAGLDPAKMAVSVNGKRCGIVNVPSRADHPGTYSVVANVSTAGEHKVAISFLNDYLSLSNPDPKMRGDRNLYVDSVTIQPAEDLSAAIPPTAFAQRFLHARPQADTEAARDAATRQNIAGFAFHAYRRPPTQAEVDRLAKIAARVRAQGGSCERGLQIAVEAALVSPNFLFRVESDPKVNDPRARHSLSDYELATRLSYFLWSSTPDDRLLTLAGEGKLHDPHVLLGEAHRLLQDPRAVHALSGNFAAQWLQLRKLQTASPDPKAYPQWNDDLRAAMRTETQLYFENIVTGDRSVLELLDSDYTYLNEPLARLYGNTTVVGDDFRRVTLSDGERGGVLTQASVLTVTSNPSRTSPVKRGKWVLENFLGVAIPAPPPGVPQLADDKHEALVGTLRQRMERHRSDPACASCHAQMDPIGFALENYDAIGKWRSLDDGAAIDASGRLPGGAAFHDAAGLRIALKAKSPQFVHTLSEKMLTYALGRGIEPYDRCNVDAIAHQVAAHGDRFSALIDAIVLSDPFRNRRGDSGAPSPAAAALPARRTETRLSAR